MIGVNGYDHLRGGDAEEREQYRGLKQLTSPVPSAFRIVRWLLNDRVDATAPLRSLQVLVSSPGDDVRDLRDAGATCAAPTIDNVEQALIAFKRRGDEYSENELLLYFCGCGLSFGSNDTLLLEALEAGRQIISDMRW